MAEDPTKKARAEALAKAHEQLKKVRASKTVSLKPIARLKETITGFDGKPQPFKLRYYQVQGAYHLMLMKRLVLGDSTGTGKTIQAIAAMAYLWEREPNNKVIVLAPKSALRQWANEIKRFTNDVNPIVASGTLDERKAAYMAFQHAPTGPNDPKVVLIMNYAILIRDWNQDGFQPTLPNGRPDPKKPVLPGLLDKMTTEIGSNLVVTYDECFDYFTPITLADGSTELIGKIVCGKKPVKVLSWNFERQQFEGRQVLRWIRNPLKGGKRGQGRREYLLKLEFKYARSCRVTKSHEFYRIAPLGNARWREDGASKIKACLLKVGSDTTFLNLKAPSADQEQIILGGMLGDASVSFPKRHNWGVVFGQGEDQLQYLNFKKNILEPLGVSRIAKGRSGYGGKPIYRFRMNSNPSLCSKFSFCNGPLKTGYQLKGPRKTVTLNWLNAITPLGLAVWYGDDGSLGEHLCKDGRVSRHITLSTHSFTPEENQLLAGWLLWKWGIRAQVKPTAKGCTLYLPDEAAQKFLLLMPGALPGVEYKFPGLPVIQLQDIDVTPRRELVRDEVTKVEVWKRAPKKRDCTEYVYDLEVEENHNYFAGGSLVSNCTAFKNMRTKTWEVARFLADKAHRCYGLSATLLKNNLMEGFCIYKAIKPDLFGTKTKFYEDYCFIEMKQVARARIPVILGYKNLDRFRETIDPFFLGRQKHQISEELPTLTTREIPFEITRAEDAKYEEALNGLLELGDGVVKDFEENKALVSLMYCQQVVNSLALLKFKEGDDVTSFSPLEDEGSHKVGSLGSKELALVDLLSDELDGEKVIVYTRFESLVGRLTDIVKKAGIKSTRITGKENDKARQKNQAAFQDLESDTKVVFITAAGTEAINLQAAAAMICFDAPWSWGDYVQLLGRMIRIGSPHPAVVAYHLVAERPAGRDKKTIDHHVLKMLRKKKGLIDRVLGESAVGALKFEKGDKGSLRDLVNEMTGKA